MEIYKKIIDMRPVKTNKMRKEHILKPVTDEYIDSIRGTLKTAGKALGALKEEKNKGKML